MKCFLSEGWAVRQKDTVYVCDGVCTYRPQQKVISLGQFLVDRYPIGYISFFDDLFFNIV